jgi:hypothetical protein
LPAAVNRNDQKLILKKTIRTKKMFILMFGKISRTQKLWAKSSSSFMDRHLHQCYCAGGKVGHSSWAPHHRSRVAKSTIARFCSTRESSWCSACDGLLSLPLSLGLCRSARTRAKC